MTPGPIDLPIGGTITANLTPGAFALSFKGKWTVAFSISGSAFSPAVPLPSVGSGGCGLGGNTPAGNPPTVVKFTRIG